MVTKNKVILLSLSLLAWILFSDFYLTLGTDFRCEGSPMIVELKSVKQKLGHVTHLALAHNEVILNSYFLWNNVDFGIFLRVLEIFFYLAHLINEF